MPIIHAPECFRPHRTGPCYTERGILCERRSSVRGPITLPCSACSSGDTAMHYHDHEYVGKEFRREQRVTPVRKSLREILDVIDEELRYADNSSQRLWAVLTALRGPDISHDDIMSEVKASTTEVLRGFAFPKTLAAGSVFTQRVACIGPDSPDHVIYRSGIKAAYHFLIHIKEGFAALGLKWNKENL